MRYYLDAEFNGFGGDLISIALAPEDRQAAAFYETLPCAKPEPWVIERVQPVLQKRPISRPEVTNSLAEYLRGDAEPVVISDWPEDIAHLALLMVTSPGRRLPLPKLRFELLDLPLFNSEALSEVPHNARYDAIALRDYVLEHGISRPSEQSFAGDLREELPDDPAHARNKRTRAATIPRLSSFRTFRLRPRRRTIFSC